MELNNMNFNPFQATAPILEARRVCVTIGARRLLDHVDLAILPGRVTALLGPNGAGKSTLLKVMSGSLPASSGEVLLDGRPHTTWDPAECARKRAVLAQDAHLPFAFTVEEVAMMGRYPHARHRETARDVEIVHRSLCAADTAHLSGRLFPTLSGGEKQRTHWARVLAQLNACAPDAAPDILRGSCVLLDEPTSSLDLGHQHAMLHRARALAAAGAGVLVILHDLNLAAQYADTIAMLQAGRLQAHGSPEDVLTPRLLHKVYGIEAGITPHPDNGKPQVFVRMPSSRPVEPALADPVLIHQPVTA
ncbi:MAG TPA: heme ABC transporter ATP-binding protein [Fibrobacteria bacterium]|jgi:iron complex transport system ATP-binding protein|nr:heme ABC transporter ATP-binding protein [Fibrobacteria bacterium]